MKPCKASTNYWSTTKPEIGGQNALNMAILACQIDGLKGNYATAAQNSRSIMEQLKTAKCRTRNVQKP